MPLGTFSQVTLGGVTFNTDPAEYQPLNWPKRAVILEGQGGSSTVQETGGIFAADDRLHLSSPPQRGRWMDTATVKALLALYAAPGASYQLTDRFGNNFLVYILKFVPVPDIADLWSYTMELVVLEALTVLGDVWSEPVSA